VSYFLEPGRITNPSYFDTFTALLEMPQAGPLRAQLASCEDKLLSLLGHIPNPAAKPEQKGLNPAAAADQAAAAGQAGKDEQQQQEEGKEKAEVKAEGGEAAAAAVADGAAAAAGEVSEMSR
jgi:hypothetical protein